MSTPASPSAPKPAGDHHDPAVVIHPSFEERMHAFWEKNRGTVMAVLVVILLGILAKGAWDYFAASREQGIRADYAAATTPAKVKEFIASHAGHPLAGVAQLGLADDAYAAGNYAEAVAAYEKAVPALKTGLLTSRAKFGLAMAKLAAGRTAEAETGLAAIASDAAENKSLRASAAYQLASLAASAHRAADVKKYTEQVMSLDPAGMWVQRAMALRVQFPESEVAAPAPAAAAPAIKLEPTK